MDFIVVSKLTLFFVLCLTEGWSVPDQDGYRRHELFMESPYFLGLPETQEEGASLLGTYDADSIFPPFDIAIPGMTYRNEISSWEGWPGRVSGFPIRNQGRDVVIAYAQNWRNQTDRVRSVVGAPLPPEIETEFKNCFESKCLQKISNAKVAFCTLMCVSKSKGVFDDAHSSLYNGMKTLCQATNTLYTRMRKHNITSWKVFHAVVTRLQVPGAVNDNVPLRAMIINLIRGVLSTLIPYNSLIDLFQENLYGAEELLNAYGREFVGANPGCAMITMKKPMEGLLQIIYTDPSLADYVLFQGYTLFTAVSKYLSDFPTKKQFAVVNQGLDMMLGTTCGLYLYSEKGTKSQCDQYGGYPVLDMPIPDFMWTDDLHLKCETERAKLFKTKSPEAAEESGDVDADAGASVPESAPAPGPRPVPPKKTAVTGKTENPPEEAVEDESAVKRRKRRSLLVGGRRIKRF